MTIRDLMQSFGQQRPEVPVVVSAAHAVRGSRLMAWLRSGTLADRGRKHRRVVADNVPVALFSIELQREAADIALGVSGARSPATVEKRANIGVCLPICEKILALV